MGIKVPTALVGAVLPPGEDGQPFEIKVGKLRGVDSYGMLCSARELKLSEEHGGLLVLPEDAPVGQNIRQYLDLDDQIFVIKLTPNIGNIALPARAALAGGAYALSLINTLNSITGVDLETLERSLLIQALRRSNGNQTRAGTLLGLNRDQIRYRIEKFGLSATQEAH